MTQHVDIPEEELLLPWYVSGQLTPEERARVDKALAVSPDLRLALDEERRLQAAVASAPLPTPPDVDLDALLASVAPVRAPLPRWVKPALAPKIVVVSTRYAVQFVEDASVAAIREALTQGDLGIVRGPLPDGAYILETAQGDRALDRLKRSGITRTIARTD
jgi:anti-sigma factor RsiW